VGVGVCVGGGVRVGGLGVVVGGGGGGGVEMPISRGCVSLGTIRALGLFVGGPASTCLSADPGPGPSFGSEHRPFE